jgi:hypothetical protein
VATNIYGFSLILGIGLGFRGRSGGASDTALTELRHGMIKKSLNPFRISLGNRRVYTTFAIELKTLR